MNIHPLVVHFPIALLMLYGLLELVRFQKFLDKPYWFYVKAVLVSFGALGALGSVLTGAIASGWAIGGPRIFALHQLFGLTTLVLSAAIAAGYLFHWHSQNEYSEHIMRPKFLVPLALLLLIAIIITGGLGGAMARGTDFDPFMKPIFILLGVY